MGKNTATSCPKCDSCCDNSDAVATQAQLQDKINEHESTIQEHLQSIKSLQQEVALHEDAAQGNQAKLDKLSTVCMVDPQHQDLTDDDLKKHATRLQGLISKDYTKQVELMDIQKRLLERQTELIGVRERIETEGEEQLHRIDDNISTQDRQLKYDNDKFQVQDGAIRILKVLASIIIIILLIIVVVKMIQGGVQSIRENR